MNSSQPIEAERPELYDEAADRAVPGCMLESKAAIDEARDMLRPDDFGHWRNGAVFSAILAVHDRGHPADVITVGAELERRGQLGQVGGHQYLDSLIGGAFYATSVGYYADIVLDYSRRRALEAVAKRVIQAVSPDVTEREDLPQVCANLRRQLDAVAQYAETGN